MPEETLWKGTSSQWKNLGPYAVFVLVLALCIWLQWWQHVTWSFFLLIPVAVWVFWKWLVVKTTVYSLTTERLVTAHGILTKVTNTLELYRVRDLQMVQPLLLRFLKLQNVHVFATDATSPSTTLDYLPTADDLGERLRKSVEECRALKRVRALDVVNEIPGDHAGDSPLM